MKKGGGGEKEQKHVVCTDLFLNIYTFFRHFFTKKNKKMYQSPQFPIFTVLTNQTLLLQMGNKRGKIIERKTVKVEGEGRTCSIFHMSQKNSAGKYLQPYWGKEKKEQKKNGNMPFYSSTFCRGSVKGTGGMHKKAEKGVQSVRYMWPKSAKTREMFNKNL